MDLSQARIEQDQVWQTVCAAQNNSSRQFLVINHIRRLVVVLPLL